MRTMRHCAVIAAVHGTIQPAPVTAVFIAVMPAHLFRAVVVNAVVSGDPANRLNFAKQKRRLLS